MWTEFREVVICPRIALSMDVAENVLSPISFKCCTSMS